MNKLLNEYIGLQVSSPWTQTKKQCSNVEKGNIYFSENLRQVGFEDARD